jgi:hypothetical protein
MIITQFITCLYGYEIYTFHKLKDWYNADLTKNPNEDSWTQGSCKRRSISK